VIAGSIAAHSSATLELLKHDPSAVIGFTLLGAASVPLFHMHSKLEKFGVSNFGSAPQWQNPTHYVSDARCHGWSVRPAYFFWISLVAGTAFLAYGMFHL
jgi:hypothetical protein